MQMHDFADGVILRRIKSEGQRSLHFNLEYSSVRENKMTEIVMILGRFYLTSQTQLHVSFSTASKVIVLQRAAPGSITSTTNDPLSPTRSDT